jgi:hypothetical protein
MRLAVSVDRAEGAHRNRAGGSPMNFSWPVPLLRVPLCQSLTPDALLNVAPSSPMAPPQVRGMRRRHQTRLVAAVRAACSGAVATSCLTRLGCRPAARRAGIAPAPATPPGRTG